MTFLSLAMSLVLVVYSLNGFAQGARDPAGSADAAMIVTPTCPVGRSEQFTKELKIDYFPSRESAVMKDPQSLTLRMVFNNRDSHDNDKTIAFQRRDDASWRAVVPLEGRWEYAIWYVRDDQTGRRDDNHGQYWDALFCDKDGTQLSDGIRDQAQGYAGLIFAEDLRRTTDYGQAIATIEKHVTADAFLVYDEWVYKFRRQTQQKYASRELVSDVEEQLAKHASDPRYLRRTASFLVNWQSAFPDSLVQHAIEIADQHPEPGMPSLQSDFERERAENIDDPRKQVTALGDWLAKYPDDAFYSNEVRKMRLELFRDLGEVGEAEAVFHDLQVRIPKEADLYATMASIYVEKRTRLADALRLLDEAEKNIGSEEDGSHYMVILDSSGSADEQKASLNYWRGKALWEEHQRAKAEQLLQQTVPIMDDTAAYALLGRIQEGEHELQKAKNSYLQASIRSSKHEGWYIDQFLKLSLETGTASKQAAMKELEGARAQKFAEEHYKPVLLDRPLPDFTFITTAGKKISAADLRGHTVLIDIWSSWCGPCISELNDFERVRERHPEVTVLLVATGSKLPDVKKVLRAQGISTKEIVLDEDGQATKFGLNGVPQTYLIDKNGHIRMAHYGSLNYAVSYLEADLATLEKAELN